MSFVTNVQNFVIRASTEFRSIRAMITGTSTGDLSALETTTKASIIAAINEVKASGGGGGGATVEQATEVVAGIVELATILEVQAGVDTERAVTPAGVAAAIAALVDAAPETLNTLNELAAALGDDPNAITTITTALANRVATTAGQGLDATQQQNARDNIDVYSKTEIGDVTVDFVAAFESALNA